MVFAEIKPQIEQLDPEERLKALAFLKHLVRANNPEYQEELALRNADMDAGQKIRWIDLKRDLGQS